RSPTWQFADGGQRFEGWPQSSRPKSLRKRSKAVIGARSQPLQPKLCVSFNPPKIVFLSRKTRHLPATSLTRSARSSQKFSMRRNITMHKSILRISLRQDALVKRLDRDQRRTK